MARDQHCQPPLARCYSSCYGLQQYQYPFHFFCTYGHTVFASHFLYQHLLCIGVDIIFVPRKAFHTCDFSGEFL